MSFWEGRDCVNYIGIDVSEYIIEQNEKKRPKWKFLCSSAENRIDAKADIVFCLDLLFHIMDDRTYKDLLLNLINYSNEYIFIYTWEKNPLKYLLGDTRRYLLKKGKIKELVSSLFHELTTDYRYQTYRDLLKYKSIFEEQNFDLIAIEKIQLKSFGAMYIFKKNKDIQ